MAAFLRCWAQVSKRASEMHPATFVFVFVVCACVCVLQGRCIKHPISFIKQHLSSLIRRAEVLHGLRS